MFMASFSELLVLLMMSLGGGSADLATLLDPGDYFKMRNIEINVAKMMELATAEPKGGGNQISQLLALRTLGSEGEKLKKDEKYAEYRQALEAIATGTKAQDKQGFAKEYALRTLAQIDGKPLKAPAVKEKWVEDALGWFPASTTMAFAMDMQRGQPAPDPRELQNSLIKLLPLIPAKERHSMYDFIDQVGNIQIKRVAVAYGESAENPDDGEIMVRVTGKADMPRIVKLLEGLGLEAKERKGRKGENFTMLTGKNLPALLIVGDEMVLAASIKRNGEHLGALSKLLDVRESGKGGVMEGALKADLKRVSEKTSGFLVGIPPAQIRKGAPFPIPAKIHATMDRALKANDLQMEATFDNADQVKEFVQTVSQGRQSALAELKRAQGQPVPIPGLDLALIQQLLESFQIEGKNDMAKMRLLIPDQTLNLVPMFFLRSSRIGPPPDDQKDPRN